MWLHAHNCYPEQGQFADRLERALSIGLPVAIEQDLVWTVNDQGEGRSVVSHGAPLTGGEPTLEEHFFARVRPHVERALREGQGNTWPLMVLHLDFKTNEVAHHQAVWALLRKHAGWLTTAERAAGDEIMPFSPGPLLVLTENGSGQVEVFHDGVRVGEKLLLFGSVSAADPPASAATPESRAAWAASALPEELIPHERSNYRRWINFPWAIRASRASLIASSVGALGIGVSACRRTALPRLSTPPLS